MAGRKGSTATVAAPIVVWIVRRLLDSGRSRVPQRAGRRSTALGSSLVFAAFSAAVIAGVEYLLRRGVHLPDESRVTEPDFDIFADDND